MSLHYFFSYFKSA